MTRLQGRAAWAPSASLLQVILVEGALTVATVHATAWRVWQSWADNATKRPSHGGAREGGCVGRRTTETAKVVRLVRDALETSRFEPFADADGAHRFRLVTGDREPILTSRSYRDARSARSAMQTLMKNAIDRDRYRRREGPHGAHCFEIRAGNNRVLWSSAPYETVEALEEDLERLIRTAREAAATGG